MAAAGPEPEPMSRAITFVRGVATWLRRHRALLASSVVGAAMFFAAFFFTQWWDFTTPSLGRASYQAVFLTNGQTYFGRYYDRTGAYAKIEDVYYIQQTE